MTSSKQQAQVAMKVQEDGRADQFEGSARIRNAQLVSRDSNQSMPDAPVNYPDLVEDLQEEEDKSADALAGINCADVAMPKRKKHPTQQIENPLSNKLQTMQCYLKTNRNKFKKHVIQVTGGDIHLFRRAGDAQSRMSHPLMQSHLRIAKTQSLEEDNGKVTVLFPIQADVPPNRTRLLYFDSEESRDQTYIYLLNEQGFENQLDQYHLVKKLGEGAFSQVMLAQHRVTSEQFAIKIIPYSVYNEKHKAQITREIELQSRCKNCPNVVRFKEQFTCEDMHCIVMENMAGGDLQQYLSMNQFKPLPLEMARRVTLQVSQALQYLHQHRIIHRDIKLENIMLSSHRPDLNAKLADFGLAETVGQTAEKRGSKAGTMGYVAPEIFEGSPYGTSSDIWSLGCLLYAMLTVCLPYPTGKGTKSGSRSGSPSKKRPVEINYADLDLDFSASDDCKDLLTRLLVREPSQRLTIEEVLRHPFVAQQQTD